MAAREDEYAEALRACGVYDREERFWRGLSPDWVAEIVPAVLEVADGEIDRYRLAWLSARRRAAHEANLGAEAVEHTAADRDRRQRGHERAEAQLVPTRRRLEDAEARLEAVRAYALGRCTGPYMNEASASWVLHLLGDDLRKSTYGASMESVGEVDGETVWRLKPAEDF